MAAMPRDESYPNVGHLPKIEVTINTRKSLKRVAPTNAKKARQRVKIKDDKPIVPPVSLDYAKD